MNTETLKRANQLVSRLESCKENLTKIKYSQIEEVVARDSHLSFLGIEEIGVRVPSSLFKVIGKMIESEYIQEIEKLQNELDEL